MSTIQKDFDRIALASTDGATHSGHYHNFLLRHLPSNCHDVLEIGCGTGAFARRLAERSQHVLALDLSPEMIRIARPRSAQISNIEFEVADIRDRVADVVWVDVWSTQINLECADLSALSIPEGFVSL